MSSVEYVLAYYFTIIGMIICRVIFLMNHFMLLDGFKTNTAPFCHKNLMNG